tara:strand:+ start:298 stop:681 length:384 start_codon:yes stop_codon:yes gene_type:complete
MRNNTQNEQSPSFQFYAGDWISDPSRMRMTLEEQGAYILLYCHCWRGFKIPFDFEIMSKMCNCTTDKVAKMWPKFEHLFKETKAKDGAIFLVSTQAEAERSEQAANRARRSVAGKKGAEARWKTSDV